jgi:sec-independent protein translocase protein TatA
MPSLGVPELLIIAFLVIVIFGVGKLPQVGGAVGKSLREFRKAQSDEDKNKDKDKEVVEQVSAAASTAPSVASAPVLEAKTEPTVDELTRLREELAELKATAKPVEVASAVEEKS